jgi:transcriptional regulator with XRE-family HTH domain
MLMSLSAGAGGATTGTSAGASEEARRREFAAFLRSRRERISPDEVGLRPTERRRTPGLRREEVADLAAVGVTWYTWLEQGRPVRASAQVLQAIADALLLDPSERSYLFTLAELAEPPEQEAEEMPPFLPDLLRRLDPYPVAVQNARWDVLAFNRSFDGLLGMGSVPRAERNSLMLYFTDPNRRRWWTDWEEYAPRLVSQFRTSMARHVSDPAYQQLLDRIRHASPLFERLWQQHEVGVYGSAPKHFQHPVVGELSLIRFHLWAEPRVDGLVAAGWTPADRDTEVRLGRLLPLATAEAVS